MPANPEFSRRHLFKSAAGGGIALASIPLLGERGRAAAQETQSPDNQEGRVIMPDPEGRPQFIEALEPLIKDNMKPEGLKLLGVTPIIYDMGLTPGAKLHMNKMTEIQEFDEILNPGRFIELKSVNYDFNIFDPATHKNFKESHLYASYITDPNSRPITVDHEFAFNIDPDGKLREKGNTDKLPFDSLKSVPEKYFKFYDPAIVNWYDERVDPNLDPDPTKGGNVVMGYTPGFVERDEVLKTYDVVVAANGSVYYMVTSRPLDKIQDTQDRQQTFEETMMRLSRRAKIFQERVSQFNIPQV